MEDLIHGRRPVDMAEWRKAPSSGVVLRKVAPTKAVTPIEVEDPAVSFSALWTLSTGRRDRDRDTIDPTGWETSDYLKGGPGPVLWAHNHHSVPTARMSQIQMSADGLVGQIDFPSKDLLDWGHMIGQLVKERFLKSGSVGFDPMEYVTNEEERGFDFKRQALLEFSVVPVPANPDALVRAKSMGIDLAPMAKWADEILSSIDGPSVVRVEKSKLEQVAKRFGDDRGIQIFDLGAEEIERLTVKSNEPEPVEITPPQEETETRNVEDGEAEKATASDETEDPGEVTKKKDPTLEIEVNSEGVIKVLELISEKIGRITQKIEEIEERLAATDEEPVIVLVDDSEPEETETLVLEGDLEDLDRLIGESLEPLRNEIAAVVAE